MLALPLSLPLQNRRLVLIGAGEWLVRKLELARRTPAQISLFTPEAPLTGAPEFDGDTHLRWPEVGEIAGAALTIVAFEDHNLAKKGADLARAAHSPLNVVDHPDLSDFHIPAIIDRGSLSIGVATGGTAPVLARETRRRIEAAVPPSESYVAQFATALSPDLRSQFANVDERRHVWEQVLASPATETARSGKVEQALTEAREAIKTAKANPGIVHLVGAGPGDPELLTLKALRLLSEADVIVYDRLVGQGVLDMARRDAERLYVGKARSLHSVPQAEIHDLLVDRARAGKRVVRLKGGDPFVFGRGGEEVEALRAAGIEVRVTPGITAALGCAATTQMPLTHRDHANSVTFITGHAKDGDHEHNALQQDWRALATANHTVVVYMGVHTAPEVSARLLEHGRAPQTPVLVIENGTRADQKTTRTRLSGLAQSLNDNPPTGPTLVVIGEVAALGVQ
jgi:uroporphyrin-III C-methyltransferase / precorrin-2 dehydrogenase / sirohydrochlorin ferrochelatase